MKMKTEFDEYADAYSDLLHDPIRERFAKSSEFFHLRKWHLLSEFFRRQSLPMHNRRWLDVGCGKGELLRLGSGAFAEVAGCDPSQQMLQYCEDIPVRVQQNPLEIPFEDDYFDLVTAVCVYHHIVPAERRFLTDEIRRVLKPGGIFAIIEHNPLNPITQMIVKRAPVDANAILLRAGEAVTMIRRSNFVPVETSYFLYMPEKVYRRVGAWENAVRRVPLGGQYAMFGKKAAAASGV